MMMMWSTLENTQHKPKDTYISFMCNDDKVRIHAVYIPAYIYKFVYFILCNEIKMFAPAGRRSARAVCLCQRSAQFQICCWIAHPHIWVHTHTNNVVNIKAWIFMFASIKCRLGVSFVCVCLGGDWRTDWVGVDGVLSWWSVRMEDSDG